MDVSFKVIRIFWEYKSGSIEKKRKTQGTKDEARAHQYTEIRETRKARTISTTIVMIHFFQNFILKFSMFAWWDQAPERLGIPSLLCTLPACESSFCSPVQHHTGFTSSGYTFFSHHLGCFSGAFQSFCIKDRALLIPQAIMLVGNLKATLLEASWEWGQLMSYFIPTVDKIIKSVKKCPGTYNKFYGHIFKDTHGQV